MKTLTLTKLFVASCSVLALGACASKTLSLAGESCASHADCADGLSCFAQVCATGPVVSNPGPDAGTTTVQPGLDAGNTQPQPGSDAGSSTTTSQGKKYESCTKHSDCQDPLYCVDGACSDKAPSAPTQPTPPGDNTSYGQRGETCTTAADCATGLTCLPITTGTGATSLGRCDLVSYGLTPSGKTCGGAECVQNSDCCELPVGLIATDGTTALRSCEDVAKILGSNPTQCQSDLLHQKECFLYATYCNCANSNPWACSNLGRCTYTASCQSGTGADLPNGCPSKSRADYPLVTQCTQSKCTFSITLTGCSNDAECVGKIVVGDPIADTCSANECICFSQTEQCYRKCVQDIDCAAGYVCDSTVQLCKPAGACDTDAYCAVTEQNVAAVCTTLPGATDKTCSIPCVADHDCSPSGVGGAFTDSVCYQGFCTPLGCASDAECTQTVQVNAATSVSVHMFCTTPPASTGGTIYTSAITDN